MSLFGSSVQSRKLAAVSGLCAAVLFMSGCTGNPSVDVSSGTTPGTDSSIPETTDVTSDTTAVQAPLEEDTDVSSSVDDASGHESEVTDGADKAEKGPGTYTDKGLASELGNLVGGSDPGTNQDGTEEPVPAPPGAQEPPDTDEQQNDMEQTEPLRDWPYQEYPECTVTPKQDRLYHSGSGLVTMALPPPPAPPPPPRSTTPQNLTTEDSYIDNSSTDAGVDALSTFSLDVDTGSYGLAVNSLLSGVVPHHGTVRPEEFVNYFPGGYLHNDDGSLSVHIDAVFDPSVEDDTGLILRVGVQAPDEIPGLEAPDSIVLVIDVSGSMSNLVEGEFGSVPKYEIVRDIVRDMVGTADAGTRVSAVYYSTGVYGITAPAEASIALAETIVEEIYPFDSTNVAAGLGCGYKIASLEAGAGRNVAVVLLSDGVANVGSTDTDSILSDIGSRDDIGLTTVGVGLGVYNDSLMEQLADNADGTYHYVNSKTDIDKLLESGAAGLLTIAAEEARVQVEFNSSLVKEYNLIGYENRALADEDFRDDSKDSGEMPLGKSATALYAVTLADGVSTDGTLVDVTLRYVDPITGEPVEVSGSFGVENSQIHSLDSGSVWMRLAILAAGTAESLRDYGYRLGGVDYDPSIDMSPPELASVAYSLADEFEDAGEKRVADQLQELAAALEAYYRIAPSTGD